MTSPRQAGSVNLRKIDVSMTNITFYKDCLSAMSAGAEFPLGFVSLTSSLRRVILFRRRERASSQKGTAYGINTKIYIKIIAK